eukprot:12953009-Alexandrium_andersonii.AAC.1
MKDAQPLIKAGFEAQQAWKDHNVDVLDLHRVNFGASLQHADTVLTQCEMWLKVFDACFKLMEATGLLNLSWEQ